MVSPAPQPPSAATDHATHLRLSHLSKIYPKQSVPAVDDVSLSLEKGKILALLGPSGCGKTTMLRMIAGLIDATSGRVEVDGADLTHVPVHKRGMGMVFQSYALFPHLDVSRNVAFGLEMRSISATERDRRVREALEMVQLGHLGQRRVKELSGGQQQRVALARALVIEPAALLLDEPLSNLDAKLRDSMRTEIRSIVHRLGVTTVFVTHDQDEALSLADTIAVMRDGQIEQVGPPEQIYERPASQFVADFVGRANLLTGTIVEADSDTVSVEVSDLGAVPAAVPIDGAVPGTEVTVLIRPHQVTVATDTPRGAPFHIKGHISDRSYKGELLTYTIRVGTREIIADSLAGMGGSDHATGTDVFASWDPLDSLILP
ncbi:putative spermidine/putrescine transport system ATP-binding protein [Spinactinospora alkalitolerans]|uniref:Spermidine/putrescine import ATP-binding protein PotA n=1 Tax=Spinactinospora alkalitolerans TaxID=687207 RepID=A0A852U3N4_9ACTN|nr:ABC transporter ATP-binding protein [Spinactinospora alkalitolerans]NYE50092.1 putative spermidine/putrescine transport system ATP-binding protein [Spinactinospora alkalitolerans]